MSEIPGPRPEVGYWHLWTDAQGVTHQNAAVFLDAVRDRAGRGGRAAME